jgi:hypothetical protein
MASQLDPDAQQLIVFPGIVMSVAATGVAFFDAIGLTENWYPVEYVTIVPGGLQMPLWLAEDYGLTIPPPPPVIRGAGVLATSESADKAAIIVYAAALGALAAVESPDRAAFVSLGAMAAVEVADTAAFVALGAMAAVEVVDTAHFSS